MPTDRENPFILRVGLVNWIHGSPHTIEDEWFGLVACVVPRWSVAGPERSFEVVDCVSGARGIVHYNAVAEMISPPESGSKLDADWYETRVRCSGILQSLSHQSDAQPEEESEPLSEDDYALLSSVDEDGGLIEPGRPGLPGLLIRSVDRFSIWLRKRYPVKY